MKLLRHAWISLAALASSCGGETGQPDADRPTAEPAAVATTPAVPTGEIDQALASRGEALFQSKACIGCHTVGGGRMTGPDLHGVTDRRDPAWVLAMIVNPDSMLRTDPTARQLFMEYATPMANMNVTRDEATALYEYLRRESQER